MIPVDSQDRKKTSKNPTYRASTGHFSLTTPQAKCNPPKSIEVETTEGTLLLPGTSTPKDSFHLKIWKDVIERKPLWAKILGGAIIGGLGGFGIGHSFYMICPRDHFTLQKLLTYADFGRSPIADWTKLKEVSRRYVARGVVFFSLYSLTYHAIRRNEYNTDRPWMIDEIAALTVPCVTAALFYSPKYTILGIFSALFLLGISHYAFIYLLLYLAPLISSIKIFNHGFEKPHNTIWYQDGTSAEEIKNIQFNDYAEEMVKNLESQNKLFGTRNALGFY